ncbi:MAG: hypothetical protein IH915_04005 [Thaumarchaeota archaeon]|nr:hypothetical protein [Nitrososphaerota archaeon]
MNRKILLGLSLLIIALPISVYAVEGTITVDIDGTSVDISYDAEGVDILGIEADLNEIVLILDVQVTESPASLSITFDRAFFDATVGNEDDIFIVLADGDWRDTQETETTSGSRTILFEIPLGTEEIEIIGTELQGVSLGQPEVIEEPPEVIEEPPEVIEEPPEVIEELEVIDKKPKTECGPGTVLKDGTCVLEKICGPGTHLVGGICELDSTSTGSSTLDLPPMGALIYGAGAALVISFIIMIFLGIISRGSRQKTN